MSSSIREDQAREEIGHTDVGRSLAWTITLAFVGVLFVVPIVQHLLPGGLEPYRKLVGVVDAMGTAADEAAARGESGVLAANAALDEHLHAFENALDDSHFLTALSTSPMQALMCRLGVGNEKAHIGRDGWLFFEPGVRALTGPGFLEPEQLTARARGSTPIQPDPRPAIIATHEQLAARDVRLVFCPVPNKASIHPERLTARAEGATAPLRNPSYAALLAQLREAGVSVYDPSELLWDLRAAGPTYLATDTHWRPAAMEAVATDLAAWLQSEHGIAPGAAGSIERGEATIANLGDIGVMLKLPEQQRLYPDEEVGIHPLVDAAAARGADTPVLLLGDSFVNIFSLADMGWGADAGFADQLAYALQRPVERLTRNDAGAHATRQMLATDLARGRARLAGKRVVVWVCAARELAVGDWRLIDLPQVETAPASDTPPVAVGAGMSTGTVAAISGRPDVQGDYKDYVMKLHLTDLVDAAGEPVGAGEGLVHVLGMRDRQLLPIADVAIGSEVTLRLRPYAEVEDRYGALTSDPMEDAMLEILQTLYWGEPAP